MKIQALWVLFLTLVVGMIFGWSLCRQFDHPEQPYCPTEDSCQIDYHDGKWHITEVTP